MERLLKIKMDTTHPPPPKKKVSKNKITGMVKKRMDEAKKSEFGVRKVKKHSLLKKDFIVSATVSSRTNYAVTLCLFF